MYSIYGLVAPEPEIMRRIWKVNPGGTEAYQQALEEYKTVMIYIARRMGA